MSNKNAMDSSAIDSLERFDIACFKSGYVSVKCWYRVPPVYIYFELYYIKRVRELIRIEIISFVLFINPMRGGLP